MAKKVANHIHKLRRHTYKTGVSIFFCILDCNYKIEAALALGKTSICNECNEPFVITEQSVRLLRPHCLRCGRVVVKDADGKRKYVHKTKSVRIDDIVNMNDLAASMRNFSNERNISTTQVPDNAKDVSLKDRLVQATNPFVTKAESKTEADYEEVKDDDL